jgi:tetratricopeptide (TPR) repeat protein
MTTSRLFVNQAEEYVRLGKLDEAVSLLLEGLAAHPNYLGARVSLGKVYLKKGMMLEAVGEFQRVVEVSPDNLYAHKQLARLYWDMERTEDAIAVCQTLLTFYPKDTETQELLLDLTRRQVDRPRFEVPTTSTPALSDTTATMSTQEDMTEGEESEALDTETIADLYIRQGDWNRGAAIYRRLAERDPENQLLKEKADIAAESHRHQTRKASQIQHLEAWLEKVRHRQGSPGGA